MTTNKIRKIMAKRAIKEDKSLSKQSLKKSIKNLENCLELIDVAINILNKKGKV